MRIAHVVLSLEVGGQERLIVNLSRELARRGHDVRVVTLTPGGGLRSDLAPVEVVDVPAHGGFEPSLVPRIARAFWRMRPDVVHTHNAAPLIYAAPAARAALVRRVVHTKHGSHTYSSRALWLARGAAHAVSAFVAVSDETAAIARRTEKPRASRLVVVPNGIPLGAFARDIEAGKVARAELGIAPDAVVVGSVGRLVAEKDYPLLVRAVLPFASDRLRLVLVGEGPERGAIEAAIPSRAAPFVTLTGMRRDVPRLMSAMDIFCLSSRTEGLPLVVPEAMACGLPIVATRVGGLPGIVPPEVGLLVDHGDALALGAAIRTLAVDALVRAKLGAAACRYAHARFSLERMTRDYERLYAGQQNC
jgi:glycosyltransferase involved in cell wall biosynthesis